MFGIFRLYWKHQKRKKKKWKNKNELIQLAKKKNTTFLLLMFIGVKQSKLFWNYAKMKMFF